MKLNRKQLKIMRWSARILALAVILFGLPFYFGYGNPLPFINPDYKLWDNLWLTIFPLMFIGLGLGWKFEKIGGFLITVPIAIGLIAGLVMKKELITHMLVPFIVGMMYLIIGYRKET
ncbi:MAG TPA: hypothetical protein VEG39_13060 [Clostridia bacterium]|nr:hypothetical protein [Clostridia bacterium]